MRGSEGNLTIFRPAVPAPRWAFFIPSSTSLSSRSIPHCSGNGHRLQAQYRQPAGWAFCFLEPMKPLKLHMNNTDYTLTNLHLIRIK